MSCGTLKAASIRTKGYDVLDVIHAQAMAIIREQMDLRGLERFARDQPLSSFRRRGIFRLQAVSLLTLADMGT